MVKNLPTVQETLVLSLGWEDSLEKEMAALQYSCMGNSMDRGAWQTTVHGVAIKVRYNLAAKTYMHI